MPNKSHNFIQDFSKQIPNHCILTNNTCPNHPSCSLQPSETDKALTYKFIEAGKLLDIKVVDHLTLTDDNYYSSDADGLI